MARSPYSFRLLLLEIFMLISSMIIILPLLIMLLGSFKTQAEAAKFNLSLPADWQFNNYVYAYKNGGIATGLFNSLLITSVSVCFCILFAVLCSFIIARKNSRFTKGLYFFFFVGLIAPLSIIPTINILQKMSLYGTFTGVILLYIAINLPWSVFIFTGFIKTVPKELDEAAIVDGSTAYRMFFRLILPLLMPVVATNIIIISMSVWNDFMIPLYFFTSSTKWTLPLSIYNFFGQYSRNWNYVFADLIIVTLPLTLVFLYCQKYIISGLTAGAVKG